ncbi:putative chymopapain protein [Arabidopsis thaliana]
MGHYLVPIHQTESSFDVFKKNAEYIVKTNKERKSYKTNEFVNAHTCFDMSDHKKILDSKPFFYENMTQASDSLDWREKGAVTNVKDQGPTCSKKS